MPEPVAYRADGTPIPDAEVQSAIAKGEAHFLKGQTVNMVDPYTGERQAVPAEQAAQKIQVGNQVLTPAQVEEYNRRQEMGKSGGHAAASFALGAASGLTLGGSDALIAQSPEGKQYLQDLEATHGTARTLGQIGSLAVPIAGELGIGGRVVKGATAIPRTLSAGARVAGEAATESLGGGLAARAVGGAVSGAIEGGVYNAGQTIGESAIHDQPLTAQKLLFAAAEGGGIGGALGGTLGMLSRGAHPSTALERAPEALPTALESAATEAPAKRPGLLGFIQSKLADQEVDQTLKAGGFIGSTRGKLSEDQAIRFANRIKELGAEDIHQTAERAQSKLKIVGAQYDELGKAIEDRALTFDRGELTADLQAQLQKLREAGTPEDTRLANRLERKYIDTFNEESKAPYRAREKLEIQRFEELQKQRHAEIMAKLADENPEMSFPKIKSAALKELKGEQAELATRARSELLSELGPVKEAPVTYEDIRKVVKRINKWEDVKNPNRSQKLAAQEAINLRNVFNDTIDKQLRKQGAEDLAQLYRDTNLHYADLSQIKQVASKRAQQVGGNRFFGLSEQLGTGAAALAGVQATGHLLGGGASALGGLALSHIAKSATGSRIAARVLHSLAGDASKLTDTAMMRAANRVSDKVATAVEKTVSSDTVKAAKGFTTAAAHQVKATLIKGASTVGELAKRLQESAAQADTSHHSALASLDLKHQDFRREVQSKQLVAMTAAMAMIPRNPADPNPLLGEHQLPPSVSESRDFAKNLEVIDRPDEILKHFNDGTLSQKQVDLVNQLAPDVMKEVKNNVKTAIGAQVAKGKVPSYQIRLRAARLTGEPVDPSDSPGFVRQMSQIYANAPEKQAPPQAAPRGGKSLNAKAREGLRDRTESFTEGLSR